MKELPIEVWGMIAQHLRKPPPPPPGEPANWNDHFNEHDLTSLMRVNKSTYQAVCPILYAAPIVQNVGLFLHGVKRPLPSEDVELRETVMAPLSAYSLPYHKLALLDQSQKLYVIHASSRITVEGEDPTKKSDARRLARRERKGWERAESIVNSIIGNDLEVTFTFARLQYLLFNTWDDGRWAQSAIDCNFDYDGSYVSESECGCLPDSVGECLQNLFDTVCKTRQITICHGGPDVPGAMNVNEPLWTISPRIHHQCRYFPNANGSHTRFYIRGDAPWLQMYSEDDCHQLLFGTYFRDSRVSDKSVSLPKLELCITPNTEEEEDPLLPGLVKEALDKYHKSQLSDGMKAQADLDNFVVLAGDELPPCPACGSSR